MTKAQQTIHKLLNSSVSNTNLVHEFNLFDRSITQKLQSTEYYYEKLISLDIYDFWIQPSKSTTQSNDSTTSQAPLLDIVGYSKQINIILDGFFMNAMSALDMLAHQIFVLYQFQQKPTKLYIGTAKKYLLKFYPNSKAGKLLDSQLGQTWFTDFSSFRHCTTHSSLIRYNDIKMSFDPVALRVRVFKIKLPDNPQVTTFTYSKKREAAKYCKSTLTKIQWLVNKVYECIEADIRKANNVLPIHCDQPKT